MAEYTSLGHFFEACANAIRAKKSTTDKIKPINFPEEIATIGISGSTEYVVTPKIQMTVPKSTYAIVGYTYSNGEVKPVIEPLWAFGSTSATMSNVIVGSDLSFVTTSSTTARSVSVTGGLSVKENSSGNVIVHVDNTEQGTITIS